MRATGEPGGDWSDRVRAEAPEALQQLAVALTVEAMHTNRELDSGFAVALSAQLRLIRLMGRIADLKSKLQRTDPLTQTTQYNQMFSVLLGLESERAQLKQQAVGAT